MRFDNRWNWCVWLLLIAAACLTLGQNCAGPPSNVPVASACGLHAAYCVEVMGKSPFALAAGDFNGDGLPDAAAANFGTDNFELLFNNGGGMLVPGGRYKAGDSPSSIKAADLNGDGLLDLAGGDGIGIADVRAILEHSGLGMPAYYKWRSRSGCYFCFYQQLGEWQRLRDVHPELFEAAKKYEKHDGGRSYTWDEGRTLDEIADLPEKYPLPVVDDAEGCAICHL